MIEEMSPQLVYTLCVKKGMTLDFLNSSVKNERILVIFGIQNPGETSHQEDILNMT